MDLIGLQQIKKQNRMTPKEKAKELIDKYQFVYIQNLTSMFEVKQCALIAVDELIISTCVSSRVQSDFINYDRQYWQEVKQEIINL
jgi:hypothetical protein